MFYACDTCHFIFKRFGAVDACPDCGKPSVREATESEKKLYGESVRDTAGQEVIRWTNSRQDPP